MICKIVGAHVRKTANAMVDSMVYTRYIFHNAVAVGKTFCSKTGRAKRQQEDFYTGSLSWRLAAPLRAGHKLLGNLSHRFHSLSSKEQLPCSGEYGKRLLLTPAETALAEAPPLKDTVSFIIPTYNAGNDFPLLLEMLNGQKGLANTEILVVDSGSKDSTVSSACAAGAKVVEIPNEDFTHSYARNLGVQHSTGQYLFMITQDILPDGLWWARRMLEPLLDGHAVAASCAEAPRPDADLYARISNFSHDKNLMGLHGLDRVGTQPKKSTRDALRQNAGLSDVACVLRADIARRFPYQGRFAEDLDLGLRLLKGNHNIAFLSSVKVVHSHNRPAYYWMKRAYVNMVALVPLLPESEYDKIYKSRVCEDILCQEAFRTWHALACLRQFWDEIPPAETWPRMLLVRQARYFLYGAFLLTDTSAAKACLGENNGFASGDAALDDFVLELHNIRPAELQSRARSMLLITRVAGYLDDYVLPYLKAHDDVITTQDIYGCLLNYFAAGLGETIHDYIVQGGQNPAILEMAGRLTQGV